MQTPDNPYAGQGTLEPPPPPKKGLSGCVIVLLVFVGLGVVGMIGIGVAVYSIAQNPEVKEVFGAMAGMMKAPGRDELVAAGCEDAMVMDTRGIAKLARRHGEGAGGGAATEAELEQLDSVLVICAFTTMEPKLDCDAVARTYLQAVAEKPPAVSAFVQHGRGDEPLCAKRYDATGKVIGEAVLPDKTRFKMEQQVEIE